MAIKDWHEDDRPREKLLKLGAQHLSDAEILAIFLRTGTKDKSAITLARDLIQQFGSLAALLAAPQQEVLDCHGMGVAKYAQILASLEMASRFLNSQLQTTTAFNQSHLVKTYLATQLKNETKEIFALLCLDDELRLLDYEPLFVGGFSDCNVCIRRIMKHALSHSASGLIVAHNHPYTHAEPSADDDEMTQLLFDACNLLGIHLIDHVIVGRNQMFSYAENKKLPN